MNRLYRLALALLPREVREERGEEMALVFEQLLAETRQRSGRGAALGLLARELATLGRFAVAERRRRPALRAPEIGPGPGERRSRSPIAGALRQDVRYAARTLVRSPGFSAVAILTIALAIGPNAAIFSIVNRVLLAPLPYPDPDRLVVVGHHIEGADGIDSTTPGNFYDLHAGTTAFDALAAFTYGERTLRWEGHVERLTGVVATGELFEVLGRRAEHGRTFDATDDRPGSEPVIVLAHGLARRIFGRGDPTGETILVNDTAHAVTGVMPPDFVFPDHDAEFWIPARYEEAFRANRNQFFLRGVGRLRDGVSIDEARAQLDVVFERIRRDHPQHTGDTTAGVRPLRWMLIWNVRERLLVLMGAVGVVLLVACANVANLLLARSASRRREIAVRRALGARSGRLVRQLLTESLVLGLAGGIAGIVLAKLLLAALVRWLSPSLPLASSFGIDPSVLAFTAGISILAALAFGIVPALQFGRGDAGSLGEGRKSTARSGRLRATLVAAEVALALVLLAGAGLLLRSFETLLREDVGFRRASLLTFEITSRMNGEDFISQRHVEFFDRLREGLAAIPGVDGVAMASTLPVSGQGSSAWFNLLDRPLPADATPPAVPYRVVDPGFFEVMGIPLLRGRGLEPSDALDTTRAVVISRSVAEEFWPGEDPIGKRIYLGAPEYRLFPDGVVVGIVGDVKQSGLAEREAEAVYFTHRTAPYWPQFSFALRTSVPPESLAASVRTIVREIDPALPVVDLRPMDEVIGEAADPARLSMALVSLFAMLALGLSIVGVYGVLTWSVTERRGEIGVRMALGATGGEIHRLVLRQGMRPVGLGVVAGLGGAVALTRVLESLLFGVTPTDPQAFAGATLLLVITAAVASWIPARRAVRQDPAAILRHE